MQQTHQQLKGGKTHCLGKLYYYFLVTVYHLEYKE